MNGPHSFLRKALVEKGYVQTFEYGHNGGMKRTTNTNTFPYCSFVLLK